MHRGFAIGVALLATTAALAQTPNPPLPAFDVVSVRPFQRNGQPWHRQAKYDPQRLYIEGMFTEDLIREAYQVTNNQIVGLPPAMQRKLFTIVGTTDQPTSPEQMRLMLRRVLADRFHLVLEDTTRVQPVYDLVVAPGGPHLRPSHSDTDCNHGTISSTQYDAFHLPPGAQLTSFVCTVTDLVARLNGLVGISMHLLPVLDKTGLHGQYAIVLWRASSGIEPDPDHPDAHRPVNLEPLEEALKRELGLELVKSTGPYRVLTIKHIAVPTAN